MKRKVRERLPSEYSVASRHRRLYRHDELYFSAVASRRVSHVQISMEHLPHIFHAFLVEYISDDVRPSHIVVEKMYCIDVLNEDQRCEGLKVKYLLIYSALDER